MSGPQEQSVESEVPEADALPKCLPPEVREKIMASKRRAELMCLTLVHYVEYEVSATWIFTRGMCDPEARVLVSQQEGEIGPTRISSMPIVGQEALDVYVTH